jgi:hypothetical protein
MVKNPCDLFWVATPMKSSKASKQLRTWRSQRASAGHSPIRRSEVVRNGS